MQQLHLRLLGRETKGGSTAQHDTLGSHHTSMVAEIEILIGITEKEIHREALEREEWRICRYLGKAILEAGGSQVEDQRC